VDDDEGQLVDRSFRNNTSLYTVRRWLTTLMSPATDDVMPSWKVDTLVDAPLQTAKISLPRAVDGWDFGGSRDAPNQFTLRLGAL
jgi:hypothetical protein